MTVRKARAGEAGKPPRVRDVARLAGCPMAVTAPAAFLPVAQALAVELGGEPFVADVAVRDGVITAVGPDVAGPATREIDATGLLVTPGFVDAHVHTVFGDPIEGETWRIALLP